MRRIERMREQLPVPRQLQLPSLGVRHIESLVACPKQFLRACVEPRGPLSSSGIPSGSRIRQIRLIRSKPSVLDLSRRLLTPFSPNGCTEDLTTRSSSEGAPLGASAAAFGPYPN